jgi:hypothetical protein
MEKTPEQIAKEKKSIDKGGFAYDVENLITEIKVVKRDLNLLNSKNRIYFLEDLTNVITKYKKICIKERSESEFGGGNKSRCKKLKRRSNKTKKIKGKRFHSRRNKK